ncbi:uncharacterized protein N7487_004658 [Penicillium crustosum]|uniref:uncharacterized protein n=1 Tax=Penicillium crustosum TaxID=36656 RepID=UPI00239EF46F|nr:uncharacterized protein N7487_004658 [Penicillium crustosum]KAJ5410299.1 hypothetical protein N7487_004658 [Penicillium crustosum]
MLVPDTGDPVPQFQGQAVYYGLTPVAPGPVPVPVPVPAQYGPEYFGPPSIACSAGTSFIWPADDDSYNSWLPISCPPPLNIAYTNPNYSMGTSYPRNPADVPEKTSREWLFAYRKFMTWTHTVYYSSNSPEAFVNSWKHALAEMKEAFGPPSLPTVFVLNQFLAAVSVHPSTIPWIESLQFKQGSLPASILDEAYADFLEFEADRLGTEPPALSDIDSISTDMDRMEISPKAYCPYHRRLTRHPVDQCFRNPRNTKRKRRWRRRQVLITAAVDAEKKKWL